MPTNSRLEMKIADAEGRVQAAEAADRKFRRRARWTIGSIIIAMVVANIVVVSLQYAESQTPEHQAKVAREKQEQLENMVQLRADGIVFVNCNPFGCATGLSEFRRQYPDWEERFGSVGDDDSTKLIGGFWFLEK